MLTRNLEYWVSEFNVLGVVQQFNNEFRRRFHQPFYGILNIIIYDRKNLKEIDRNIDTERFLTGYLPKGESEFWDYDYAISVQYVMNFSKIISELNNIKDKVFVIQLEVDKLSNGESRVRAINSW